MRYIARVTIHNGTYQEYETLHILMQQTGFKRYITAADGMHYWLPDATYECTSQSDLSAVQSAAQRAARAAAPGRKEPQVLVAKYEAASWTGLEIAR